MAFPSLGDYTNASPEMRRFLAAHPEFAQMTSVADRQRFLTNHPAINAAYQRIVTSTSKPAPASGSTSPTASGTAPVTTIAPTGPSAETVSAAGTLKEVFTGYGLPDLGQWAWQQYLNGTPASQIMADLRQRPEYQARFPGMAELAQKGRAISEDHYIGLEQEYVKRARAYGLPATFYDSADDFGKMIGGEESPEEYERRLQMASRYSNDSPEAQRLRDAYARYYGPVAGQGAAIAYMIDPNMAIDVLQRQHEAAQAGAAAALTGFGSLRKDLAERVGALHVSEGQAQQTFSNLAQMEQFKASLPGDTGDQAINDEDLIAAGFEQNAQAQQRIDRTKQRRVAAFQGGGGYAGSGKGLTGLGTANG